jgi:hypothetical protein
VADAHSSSPLEGRVEAMESLIQHLLSKLNQGQLPDTPATDVIGIAEAQVLPEMQLPKLHPYNTDSVDGMCTITFAGEYFPGYFGMDPALLGVNSESDLWLYCRTLVQLGFFH